MLGASCLRCDESIRGTWLRSRRRVLRKSRGTCPACGHDRFLACIRRTAIAHSDRELLDRSRIVRVEKDFDLPDISGQEILEIFTLPVREASAWMTRQMKEHAKKNLRPGQGLCRRCGEIYNRAFAGHTVAGYCSTTCERRGRQAELPPSKRRVVDCPHCRRRFEALAPSGTTVACTWCRKRLARP